MLRRAAAALSLVLGLPGAGASAQDAPPPATDGREALVRLSALSPSPGAAGFRVLRCRVTPLEPPEFPLGVTLTWAAGRPPSVAVRLPDGYLPAESAARLRTKVETEVSLAFMTRAAWDVAALRDATVTLAAGPPRVVTVAVPSSPGVESTLVLAEDGFPTEHRLRVRSGPVPPFALRFVEHGHGRALAEVRLLPPAPAGTGARIHYFAEPRRLAVPRRIDSEHGGTAGDSYLLHDVFLDERPVPGTTPAGALAGRPAKADDGSRALLDGIDAATARIFARTASCKLAIDAGNERYAGRVTVRDDGSCAFEPDAAAAAIGPDGHRGIEAALSTLLRAPSAELREFDASLPAARDGAPREIVLTPLVAEHVYARLVARVDDDGLLAEVRHEPRGDGAARVLTRAYVEREVGHAVAQQTVVEGPVRHTTVYAYWDVPDQPALRRSAERTHETPQGTTTYRETYTDWTLDGKPVPGTESAPPPQDGSKK